MKKDTTLDQIIAYENGSLTDEQSVAMFQELIDSGLVWQLQGSYGRTARSLIETGYCSTARILRKRGLENGHANELFA